MRVKGLREEEVVEALRGVYDADKIESVRR